MKIGPKYKIARRLGAPIFEKTQTQKYALSLARKEKGGKLPRRPKSEFGLELIEKQKARLSYGLSEKQFRNYVKRSLVSSDPQQKLFQTLESRLDNVLYRSGFAKTRLQARQLASHGHTEVNGRRVTIPSILVREGDRVSLRPGGGEGALAREMDERTKGYAVPSWLGLDIDKREVRVAGQPAYVRGEQIFDLGAVIEFYNR